MAGTIVAAPVPAQTQRLLILAGLITMLLLSGTGRLVAQELEPLTFSNTPTGINVLGAGVGFSRGNILLDPSLPIEDLDGDLFYGFLRYLRTFGLLGRAAKFSAMVPFTSGEWDGQFENQPANREANGFGDIRLTLDWSLYGAPAMNRTEMQSYQPQTIVGASVRVIAPTGDYDSDELINLGANRWSVRGQIGLSRELEQWTFEGLTGIWFYGVVIGLRADVDRLFAKLDQPAESSWFWFGVVCERHITSCSIIGVKPNSKAIG